MKVKLPDMPHELFMALPADCIHMVRAYALQAIREFVEGLEPVAWLFSKDSDPGGLYLSMMEPIGHEDRTALIIKPELDDADL